MILALYDTYILIFLFQPGTFELDELDELEELELAFASASANSATSATGTSAGAANSDASVFFSLIGSISNFGDPN